MDQPTEIADPVLPRNQEKAQWESSKETWVCLRNITSETRICSYLVNLEGKSKLRTPNVARKRRTAAAGRPALLVTRPKTVRFLWAKWMPSNEDGFIPGLLGWADPKVRGCCGSWSWEQEPREGKKKYAWKFMVPTEKRTSPHRGIPASPYRHPLRLSMWVPRTPRHRGRIMPPDLYPHLHLFSRPPSQPGNSCNSTRLGEGAMRKPGGAVK